MFFFFEEIKKLYQEPCETSGECDNSLSLFCPNVNDVCNCPVASKAFFCDCPNGKNISIIVIVNSLNKSF